MHKTIIFITHDLDEALKLGSRIAIMKDGEVVQVGAPEEILSKPANDYVRAFVQNVDRSKALTASSIMQKAEVVYDTSGPHQTARKMRQLGLSTMLVVDNKRKFSGYVKIDDAVALQQKVPPSEDEQDKHTIRSIIQTDMNKASPDDAIAELVGAASTTALPFAIVDSSGKLAGIVTRPAILAGIAGD